MARWQREWFRKRRWNLELPRRGTASGCQEFGPETLYPTEIDLSQSFGDSSLNGTYRSVPFVVSGLYLRGEILCGSCNSCLGATKPPTVVRKHLPQTSAFVALKQNNMVSTCIYRPVTRREWALAWVSLWNLVFLLNVVPCSAWLVHLCPLQTFKWICKIVHVQPSRYPVVWGLPEGRHSLLGMGVHKIDEEPVIWQRLWSPGHSSSVQAWPHWAFEGDSETSENRKDCTLPETRYSKSRRLLLLLTSPETLTSVPTNVSEGSFSKWRTDVGGATLGEYMRIPFWVS